MNVSDLEEAEYIPVYYTEPLDKNLAGEHMM